MHAHQVWWAWLLFGDIATFQNWPNFPFGLWTIVHGGQKIESTQKIHASRG